MSQVLNASFSRRGLLGLGAGLAVASTLAGCAGASTSGGGDVTFFSTQFAPVEEKQRFEKILTEYVKDVKVGFNALPSAADFNTQLKSQVDAKKVSIGVAAAIHGDLAPLGDYLDNVDDLVADAKAAGITDDLLTLGKMGTAQQKYIPWMQASYVVCVNKKALEWLPSGADVNALTYDQFLQWAVDANKANGKPVFGFPAGPKGLYHRFFQGYLLPSFTGGVVSRWTSDDAVKGWTWMQEFWKNCNPASTNYEFMQEPLARGEVLVAWDHVARLVAAPKDKPEDWIMVPAPIGDKGLGYMLIVAGMAVPKGGDKAQAAKVIKALSAPAAQVELLRQNAFFPVVKADLPTDLPGPIKLAAEAIEKQATSPKALLALPPVGLGAKDGEFGQVFKDVFRETCLQGADPKATITKYATNLETILAGAKVPCWAPDPAADVCKVG
ncbi:carbohydrate ABC transporter substrate-binding protein [Propioniciclava coleopterorum]|uniref:Carbohydrate ABC transporter substrate-binding protein n=1 Tax=Propioniciclava coleopterorum TaxID=2714937 RepID=A0A6G7Y9R3_9ACTN|nr:ABC transporter substrate-binding protein [Propioniciclava coleopterorum]QIK73634.1 carbohydrate ABC transporter substrate-binding protein [Propioniciclava coleopterorum]